MVTREPTPHVLRTPAEHYQLADKLLHEVDGADMSLPFVRHKVARAQVHAMLAQCFQHEDVVDVADYNFNADPYLAPVIETATTTNERL